MNPDPIARGRGLAAFFQRLEPGLWRDLVDSGLVPAPQDPEARTEWTMFALHACVRGLVGAGGFGDDGARAVEALHEEVARHWPDDGDERRAVLAVRYDEYGAIERAHAARGDEGMIGRLGAAAARHVSGTDIANAELGVLLGDLYDAIRQGTAEHVRGDEA